MIQWSHVKVVHWHTYLHIRGAHLHWHISTPVGFEPARGDPIGVAGRRLSHSAKVSYATVIRCADAGVCSYQRALAGGRCLADQGAVALSSLCARSPARYWRDV